MWSRRLACASVTAPGDTWPHGYNTGNRDDGSLGDRWLHAVRRREDDERGQGMVEYALILVLITIVVIVIPQVVGQQTNNVFSNVANGLNA
jgi:pilus assembly protein Flp/PilA